MTMRDVERQMWPEVKKVFCNPKLRLKDILEWSSSEIRVRNNLGEGEVMIQIPSGIWVCVSKANDKRSG